MGGGGGGESSLSFPLFLLHLPRHVVSPFDRHSFDDATVCPPNANVQAFHRRLYQPMARPVCSNDNSHANTSQHRYLVTAQYCHDARDLAPGELDQGATPGYRALESSFAQRITPKLLIPCMLVLSSLDAADTQPNRQVGAVGIGGLGQMAVLIVHAMGCSVTAISDGMSKLLDAPALGAHKFYDSWDADICYSRCRRADGDGSGRVDARKTSSSMNADTLSTITSLVPEPAAIPHLLARMAAIMPVTVQSESTNIPGACSSCYLDMGSLPAEALRESHITMLDSVARINDKTWMETSPIDEHGNGAAFDQIESCK
ncbi:hypothetical protein K431DRAFT_292257 [Polychaeton citri CBS 116435]|uniref:Alcohol dehydrogenase-like C-terminal domain-containing protein n=1 Tax=Polychaeton citri CBS 116435 TaxID=1314669 RepID=A0A9P4UTC7_9PEZI|nr:hypothetical protein K431DRAFT_292257 [Polychaeton citri CBS 116435]